MAHAAFFPALERRHAPFESLRMALVYGCALALIAAGPFFPGMAW